MRTRIDHHDYINIIYTGLNSGLHGSCIPGYCRGWQGFRLGQLLTRVGPDINLAGYPAMMLD